MLFFSLNAPTLDRFRIIYIQPTHTSFMKCSKCGICCKLFLISLTEEEYKSMKYKTQFEEFGLTEDFKEAEMCGANIITPNKDGSCMYLIKGKCSIHKTRPRSCRNFFCTDTKFKTMIKKIEKHKQKTSNLMHLPHNLNA